MRLCSVVAAVAFISTSLVARADSFDFTFGSASSPFSGSGVLTTGALEAPGEYSIASLTGTAETVPNGPMLTITHILAPGVFPTPSNGNSFPANDNTLFVINGVGSLSQDGLSFILSNGAQINLFDDGPGPDALLERANGTDVLEDASITIGAVAPTPEPSSFALLGTGLLATMGMLKRRRA
jgi:hypothetical protein